MTTAYLSETLNHSGERVEKILVTPSQPKRVIFMSQKEVEMFVPSESAALISIVDHLAWQSPNIDLSYYESVIQLSFLKGAYSQQQILAFGSSFNSVFASYFKPSQARNLIAFISAVDKSNCSLLVVHCLTGRGRAAAVARYASEKHGFKLDQSIKHHSTFVFDVLMQPEKYDRWLSETSSAVPLSASKSVIRRTISKIKHTLTGG